MTKFARIFEKDWIKRKWRSIYLKTRVTDVIDWITIRSKEPLVPLRRNIWGGPALSSLAFYNWALGDIKLFEELAQIKPDNNVLDVGCGIGRCALGFSKFLDNQGSYSGFDANLNAIESCKKIEKLFPNFSFKHVDLRNSYYNPNGKLKPSEFNFPYESNKFDFVFLISVFTHMFPNDIENYISEISRVLKKGGKCLITFFVKNNEDTKSFTKFKPAFSFSHKKEIYYIENTNKPEYAVAYELEYIEQLLIKNSLKLREPVLTGSWTGNRDYRPILKSSLKAAPEFTRFQDIVLAEKI